MTEHPSTTLGIIGLGYVGLPLAVEAGRAGIRVIGFDVNPSVVDIVNSGESHIQDVPATHVEKLVEGRCLEATTDMTRLRECDVVSICVPTPLSKTRDPDVSYILAASKSVSEGLHVGQVIVLESTTYPGTTREVLLPALEATGLRVGKDFHLCFSPERVDPGNPKWNTRNTPKVIGGITQECTAAGVAFYEKFLDTLVPVSSSETAEMTKILENTFRAVNIGLVNETALIAERLGVDVWEVIEAANTKPFGFMKFTPGPGLGGHCIPVDPHYLSWKMRTLNYKTRFIELASEINSEMPYFVVDKVREALNRKKKSVHGARILLLGVAYKRDIGDVRESPALDVLKLLIEDGAVVSYHDPFVPKLHEEGVILESVELTDEVLSDADVAVILTDHSQFNYVWILENVRMLVDTRNASPRHDSGAGHSWIVKG
ncbi:MAG: UDP-N-acetyl-D-glucosamine dehydrogenase [Gemmatimonadetes bacterium]|mgnify:FL=1|nr:UDP-N-acetyl-D-glucosamine dehydrogenase [Gemmatimonadota bacterium]|tara:strand:+ start:2921 stop:4213 length:1293 start_codon:yes stop_codon:yes gene_type:complete